MVPRNEMQNKRMNLSIGESAVGGPALRSVIIYSPLAGYPRRSADIDEARASLSA